MTANNERQAKPVKLEYVWQLSQMGKIASIRIDERTRLYKRSDVEAYRIHPRGDGSVRRATRHPKQPPS